MHSAPPPARFLLCVALASAGLAGCTDEPGPGTPDIPPIAVGPNFLGNWSLVEGNFSLYRTQTHLERHNATSGEPVAYPASCPARFAYSLDEPNRTITVDRHLQLHPIDPSPLRILFLNELHLSPGCVQRGVYGINEGQPAPPICFWGADPELRNRTDAWRCHLPYEPLNSPNAVVWLNVSFTLDDAAPGGFWAGANGRTFGGNQSANFTFTATHGTAPLRYTANVTMEPVAQWPYGAVRRTPPATT